MVPVAVQKMVVDVCLDLALFLLLVALGVTRVVFTIGINRRGERDALAIRRPVE